MCRIIATYLEPVPKAGLLQSDFLVRSRSARGQGVIHMAPPKNSLIAKFLRYFFCVFRRWKTFRPRYAALRRGCALLFLRRANIHRLCVNTPQASASSRWINPLARIGRPKNPRCTMLIRASVCDRRFCIRTNRLFFMRFLRRSGLFGQMPSKISVAFNPMVLAWLANPRSAPTADTFRSNPATTRSKLSTNKCASAGAVVFQIW